MATRKVRARQEEAEPSRPARVSVRDRFRLMGERDAALLALPVSDHDAYLEAFYEEHPGWPFAEAKCKCVRCILAD